MKRHLLRNLYLVHRWLGIAIGMLVLCWFASGVVMMYVPYPHLTDAERHAAQTPLIAEQVKVTAATAWQAAREQGAPDAVRLANLATIETSVGTTRPAYLFSKAGNWTVVWADNGARRTSVSPNEAVAAAQAMRSSEVVAIDQIDVDQWSLGGLNAHRPLYRIELADSAGSMLYVSSRTGEVVRDTDRTERILNWFGAVIHWIYFAPLRTEREPWRQVVMWTSAMAFSLVLTGATIGLLRLRLRSGRRYSNGRITPYQGWKRWHHFLGVGVSLVALTWLFSGWLSVNPFALFDHGGVTNVDRLAVAGGKLDQSALQLSTTKLLTKKNLLIVEVEWLRFSGQGYFHAHEKNSENGRLISAQDFSPAVFSADDLLAAARRLRTNTAITASTWLTEGDVYYYRHHDELPLPVLRVDFADADNTSFYLDPATGHISGYANSNSRVYRWLFNGLHRLDFPFLIRHRPVWDVIIIALCLCGFVLSLSGLVIGWRRLRK